MTLTATPASGYMFTSWGGACSGTSDDDQRPGGCGEKLQRDVHGERGRRGVADGAAVHADGHAAGGRQGTGGGDPVRGGGDGVFGDDAGGDDGGLEAVPSAGYTFTGWSGDCSGRPRRIWSTLNGARTCGASFTPTSGGDYALTIAPVPTGGTVRGAG